VSRLKQFLRRKQNTEVSLEPEEKDDEDKPVEPTRGLRRILSKFVLYYPLGSYQRALNWTLTEGNKQEVNTEGESIDSPSSKHILIKEKAFRSRMGYFLSISVIQSIGLSIVFTAPISLPWIFNVVIPFSIDLLPFGLADFIRSIISGILNFLSPLAFVVDIFNVFTNLTATYNPMYFYGSTLFLLKAIGLTDVDPFSSLENSEFEGNSMSELLATTFLSKYSAITEIITPLIILVSSLIAFFLVFRRARVVIFEILTENDEKTRIRKSKRKLLGYYMDKGYSDVIYEKNRISDTTKLKKIAWFAKWGPLIAFILPIILAIVFIFL
jgi:hypothetical protein